VSKVAGEALGRLYHDRHAMDVVCLRIGSFRERPSDRRSLWNWLSPDDCTRLFEAALQSPAPGFRIVWEYRPTPRASSHSTSVSHWLSPLDDAERLPRHGVARSLRPRPEQSILMAGLHGPDFDEGG